MAVLNGYNLLYDLGYTQMWISKRFETNALGLNNIPLLGIAGRILLHCLGFPWLVRLDEPMGILLWV